MVRTSTGAEGNNIGEGTVSFVISGLNFDEIRSVGREALDGGGHLVTDDPFDDPIAIPLRTVRRVEDDVSRDLAVGLFGRLPIQVDGRRVLFDGHDGEIPRRGRRRRLERRVGHHQTPRTLLAILRKDPLKQHCQGRE